MMQLRRDFLKSVTSSVAGLPLLVSPLEDAAPRDGLAQSQELDQATYNFWASQVREPYDRFVKGLSAKGATFHPEFIFYDPKTDFQRSSNIDDSKFPKNGNVNVAMQVERFRPSQASANLFRNIQSGSLRVDFKQTARLPSLQEALAWTAMAALVPKSGNQLPDLKNLSFDPGQGWGQLTQIPLTNGLGFWSWNFFLKKPQGFWGTFIDIFRKANQVVFPLLSLPGITTTALNAVDKMLGVVQAKGESTWLFKSEDSPVYATLEGKSKIGSGLPLTTGNYVVIPDNKDQLAAFGDASKNLEIQGGYLVEKNTDQFHWESNAATQIPTVDYLLLRVSVNQQSATTDKGT